jgi:hypothetical protein
VARNEIKKKKQKVLKVIWDLDTMSDEEVGNKTLQKMPGA